MSPPRAISSAAARTKLVQRVAQHIVPSNGELPLHNTLPPTPALLRQRRRSASWGAFMANTDKPDPVSSESSQDAPEAVTLSASGQPLHARAQSPVPNPVLSYSISPHSTIPDHAPVVPSSATCSPFAIPHPKRFNAVNINKKFLQKNSTSSAAAVVASLAAAAKTGTPARMSSSFIFWSSHVSQQHALPPSLLLRIPS